MVGPSTEVGPGWWAFVAFFVLAIALYLLMRNMFARLRRMRLAEQDRVAHDEQVERERSGGDGPEEREDRRDEV